MTAAKKIRLDQGLLKISEIADEAGVRSSTVKFYTEKGFLEVVAYTKGGYRLYDKEKTVRKILFIFIILKFK